MSWRALFKNQPKMKRSIRKRSVHTTVSVVNGLIDIDEDHWEFSKEHKCEWCGRHYTELDCPHCGGWR